MTEPRQYALEPEEDGGQDGDSGTDTGSGQGDFRELDARKANDRIAEKAQRLNFVSRVPMICECSSPSCRAIVMISLQDYREIREDPAQLLVAAGHADHIGLTKATANYEIRRTEDTSQGCHGCA